MLPLSAFAQEGISFNLLIPPGNNLSLDESLRAIITNNEGPMEVYLKGVVTEGEDGVVFEGASSVFTLPEKTYNINRRNLEDLKPFDVRFSERDYERYVRRTQEFPPGEYEVCVEIILASEERVIAESCFEKNIEDFLPPSLISPENKSKVTQSRPFFSWSPVPGTSGNVTYALLIAEITGNQSPIAAFESNPLWFKTDNIRSPLFQYPVSGRKLKTKQRYAWKVQAYNGDILAAESEVWSFIYTPGETEEGEEDEDKAEDDSGEEMLIPDQYVRLQKKQTSGHYLLEDYILRFVYENKYAKGHIKCNLENSSNQLVAGDILNRDQKHGLNFNELDLSDQVQRGQVYLLKCTDMMGNSQQLRFKVKKESSGNIMEGIELEEGQFNELPDNIFQ